MKVLMIALLKWRSELHKVIKCDWIEGTSNGKPVYMNIHTGERRNTPPPELAEEVRDCQAVHRRWRCRLEGVSGVLSWTVVMCALLIAYIWQADGSGGGGGGAWAATPQPVLLCEATDLRSFAFFKQGARSWLFAALGGGGQPALLECCTHTPIVFTAESGMAHTVDRASIWGPVSGRDSVLAFG
jgi:hypothetical protein